MRISKHEFLAATATGDQFTVQQYLAQPEVISSVSSLEQILQSNLSTCDNIRAASRSLMAVGRGLWFCVGGDWGGVFREAVRNQQVEVLAWFFSSAFASLCPTTLQVAFPHIVRQAVERNDAIVVEALLTSWVFCEAMAPETRLFVLQDLQWMVHSNHHLSSLLLAHGARESVDIDCSSCTGDDSFMIM